MLPDELLARADSAQLAELMAHFKMSDDDLESERKVAQTENDLTNFFGEADDD
jgi:hypothetical protein